MNVDKNFTLCQDLLSLGRLCSMQIRNQKLRQEGLAKCTQIATTTLEEIQKQAVYFGIWWSQNNIESKELDNTFSFISIKNDFIKKNRLSFKLLTHKPSAFKYFHLESLSITNSLMTFPMELFLPKIHTLEMSNCSIENFPIELLNLTSLTQLNLSSNKLAEVNSRIYRLTALANLDLSHNSINILPETFSKLTNLSKIYLQYNKIKKFPLQISSMTKLTELLLGSNHINANFPKIFHLFNLKRLDLKGNKIYEVPVELNKLTNLDSLELSENFICQWPLFFDFKILTHLTVCQNNINEIPLAIFDCTNIKILSLSKNRIKFIPDQILKLNKMERFLFTGNEITEIAILAQLNLKFINAASNPIRWDEQLLQRIEKTELRIVGFEVEACHKRDSLSPPPLENFNALLNKMSLLVQKIEKIKNNAKSEKLLEDAMALIAGFGLHFNKLSYLALCLEEIQTLKIKKFEILAKFLFKHLTKLKEIHLFLEILTPLFILDPLIFKNINKLEIYDLLHRFFHESNKLNFSEKKIFLYIPIKFLGCIERHFSQISPPQKASSHGTHPLLALHVIPFDIDILFYLVKILNFTYSSNQTKYKLDKVYLNVEAMLKETIEQNLKIHPPNTFLPPNPLLFNFINTMFASVKNKDAAQKKAENNLAEKILNSMDYCKKEYDPWYYEILLDLWASQHERKLDEYLYDFLYQQCFINTDYISQKKEISSSLLKLFCVTSGTPAKRKKSLEAIALLLLAEPQLQISAEWFSLDFVKNFIFSYVRCTPLPGEKLAWLGALKLLEVPIFAKTFINTIILPATQTQPKMTAPNFKLFWQSTLEMKDPLMLHHLDKLFIAFELLQQEANAQMLEKKEKTKAVVDILDNEIHLVENQKKFIHDTLTKNFKWKKDVLFEEIEKLKNLFKQLKINQNAFFVNPMIEDSFSEIVQKINALKEVLDGRIFFNTNFQKELKNCFTYENFNVKLEEIKKENRNLILQSNEIFNSINHEIDYAEIMIRKKIHFEAIELYNQNALSSFQNWKALFELKTDKIKVLFENISISSTNIPQMHSENILALLNDNSLIENYKIEQFFNDFEKKIKQSLYDYSPEICQSEESRKVQYLNAKVKYLEEEMLSLKQKNSLLEKRISEIPARVAEQKENEEMNDGQIVKLIKRNIKNLHRFALIKPPKHWNEPWIHAWCHIIKNLDSLYTFIFQNPKNLRNWERKEGWELLHLAGFEAKSDQLDGSHLEVKHPLFNMHTSVSFNSQKQTAIRLVKSYLTLVNEILDQWCEEIVKRK